MREIKYRGRYIFEGNVLYPDRIDEWKYGSLVIDGDKYRIKVGDSSFSVAKETVGQFTGKKDKSGEEIYEGDIIIYEKGKPYEKRHVVEFDEDYSGWVPFVNDGGCGCCSAPNTLHLHAA